MRLDKLLSRLGVCSRSECRSFLKSGRVTVDGAMPRSGDFDVPEAARVTLDVDGTPTALDATAAPNRHGDGGLYDLQGRRVAAPAARGVYIGQGRKRVVKP